MFCSQLGLPREARLHYEEAIRVFQRTGNRRLEGTATSGLAEVLRSQGQLEESMETGRAALQIHRSLGNQVQVCIAMGNLGDMHIDRDELEEAMVLLRDAIRLGDEVLPAAAGAFRGSLGLVLGIQGEFDEARAMLLQGETVLRDGNTLELGKLLCKRARVELLAGEQGEARVSVDEARSLAERLAVGPEGNLVKAIVQVSEAIDRFTRD
jgi:tetratricopeptide (TPR) repeat protein